MEETAKGDGILKWTTWIQQTAIAVVVLFSIEYHLIMPLTVGPSEYILDKLWMVIVFLLVLGVSILSWLNIHRFIGQILFTVEMVFFWLLVNDLLIRDDYMAVFPRLYYSSWILLVFITLQALLVVINLIVLMMRLPKKVVELCSTTKIDLKPKKREWIPLNTPETHKKRIILTAIAFILILIAPVTNIYFTSPDIDRELITIQPKDYTIKFAFWGSHIPTRYTSAQLEAMNRFGITIAAYTIGPLQTEEQRAAFVADMNWWKTNYPNVKFLPSVLGIPGGFVWDGSAEGTTQLAREIITLIKEQNLTNVIGLSFDWEKPREDSLGNVSSIPNRTRHENSIEIWKEFFEWKENYAPELIMQNINYVSMDVDTADGDFDLHIAERYNTYEVPYWDEYAPMIYRCGYNGNRPFGTLPEYDALKEQDTQYSFYRDLKEHYEGVMRITGDPSKVGVYIGITNCTCYGRDMRVFEGKNYIGTGFENLISDILICKHFRIPQVTIFILDTVIENGYSMGGVFDSYGDDFLDVLNESVNGPNSTQPFTIFKSPVDLGSNLNAKALEDYLRDLLYTTDHPEYLAPLVAVYLIISGYTGYKLYRKRAKNETADHSENMNAADQ